MITTQASISPAPLINLANQLRANPQDGATLSKAITQISSFLQQIAHQVSDAGFSVDQLGNLSIAAQDIREVTSRFNYSDPPGIQYFQTASYCVPFLGSWMRLANTSAGTLTLTSTPTVATPNPAVANLGPVLEFLGISSHPTVIQDHGTLAGSGLALGASSRSIGERQAISLRFSNDLGLWVEQWYAANL